jgi:hypothetical protein
MRSVLVLLLASIWFLDPAARAKDRKPRPPEADYLKVEVRGTLAVQDKAQTDLSAIQASYGRLDTGAFITAGETSVDLYLGKDLLKAARELNGKKVVLTGELLLINPPEGTERLSTVRPLPPRSLIEVTGIKAVEAK